jgi:hypothetical protein
MTLISVTMTILKPISSDAGRRTRFAQNSRAIPAAPEVPLPMLWPAPTSPHGGESGAPEAIGRRVRLVFSLL